MRSAASLVTIYVAVHGLKLEIGNFFGGGMKQVYEKEPLALKVQSLHFPPTPGAILLRPLNPIHWQEYPYFTSFHAPAWKRIIMCILLYS